MALRLPVRDTRSLRPIEASELGFNSFMLGAYGVFQVLLWGLVVNAYVSGAPDRLTRTTPVAFVIALLPAGFAYWAERGLLVADRFDSAHRKATAFSVRILLIAACVQVHSLPLRMFFAKDAIAVQAHLEAVNRKGLDLLEEHERLVIAEDKQGEPLPQQGTVDEAQKVLDAAGARVAEAKAAVTAKEREHGEEDKKARLLAGQLAAASGDRLASLKGAYGASVARVRRIEKELDGSRHELTVAQAAMELAEKSLDAARSKLDAAQTARRQEKRVDSKASEEERRRIRAFLELLAGSAPDQAVRDGNLVFEPPSIDWTTRVRILGDIESGRPRVLAGSAETIARMRSLAPSVVDDDEDTRARRADAAWQSEIVAKLILAVLDCFGLLSHLVGGGKTLPDLLSPTAVAVKAIFRRHGFKADEVEDVIVADKDLVHEILNAEKEERRRAVLEKIRGEDDDEIQRFVRDLCTAQGSGAASVQSTGPNEPQGAEKAEVVS